MTASADPRADVTKAMRASLAAKSYRSRIVTTSSSGSNRTMTAEFVAPDRMRMTTEMDMPGRGAVKNETIVIGKETFVKAGDAPWQKNPLGMGDLLAQFRDPKAIDAIAEKAQVKYLGTETLSGAPMLVYQYTSLQPFLLWRQLASGRGIEKGGRPYPSDPFAMARLPSLRKPLCR